MAVALAEGEGGVDRVPPPRWIAGSLRMEKGEDPLGLLSMTTDRFMPLLLPGILENSQRARYFSFHAFLLDEYRTRRLRADRSELGRFIKQHEWDLAIAVRRCPRHCGSSAAGAQRIGAWAQGAGPFERGESVQNTLGGYGLYYRSALVEVGIVAREGTELGDEPIPVDVLYDTERARRLAGTFREAIKETDYYRRYFTGNEPLDAAVVDEYAGVACLCRLDMFPAERDAIHNALFGADPPREQPEEVSEENGSGVTIAEQALFFEQEFTFEQSFEEGLTQRRRSVAHYLSLLRSAPAVTEDIGAYRQALWATTPTHGAGQEFVAGEWAALAAKDVWQEAVCSVWSSLYRSGLARTRELGRGLTWEEVQAMVQGLVLGPPALEAGKPVQDLIERLAAGDLVVEGPEGDDVDFTRLSIEELRQFTRCLDTATSGVLVVFELARRAGARSGAGWELASSVESRWQPSLARVMTDLARHMESSPTLSDTLWWLASNFIISIHERIAYSKLPERMFTFRFRWEDGLLRFYDQGPGRFPLAAIRFVPLASLTRDLELWDKPDDRAQLTVRGAAFIAEVFPPAAAQGATA